MMRLVAEQSPDIEASLLASDPARAESGSRLGSLIQEKYNGTFKVGVLRHPAARSDLLLQQLELVTPPEELLREAVDQGLDAFAAGLQARFPAENIDIVALSILPDVRHNLWRHRQSNYLAQPPAGWEKAWTAPQRAWFRARFSPSGLLSLGESRDTFVSVIRAIKKRLDAHIIVYNCSPIDPRDNIYSYHGVDDTLSIRIHRFNLALIQLSYREGISLIEVERIAASFGGEHVPSPLVYSPDVSDAVLREFVRVMDDIGFFAERPLVPQLGPRGESRCS